MINTYAIAYISKNREDCMFRNLKAEMARNGLTSKELSEAAEISYYTFLRKINGITEFTLSEAFCIWKKYFRNIDFIELFKKQD